MGNQKSAIQPTDPEPRCETSITRTKVTLYIHECLRKNGEKMHILVDSTAYFQPPGPSRIIASTSNYELDDAVQSCRDIANILNIVLYEQLDLPKAASFGYTIDRICN